jgi:hypothetical protein
MLAKWIDLFLDLLEQHVRIPFLSGLKDSPAAREDE